jgi:hypothetical protein
MRRVTAFLGLALVAGLVVGLPTQAIAETVEVWGEAQCRRPDSAFDILWWAKSPDPGGSATSRLGTGSVDALGNVIGTERIDGLSDSAALFVSVSFPGGGTWEGWAGLELPRHCLSTLTQRHEFRIFADHPTHRGTEVVGLAWADSRLIRFHQNLCDYVRVDVPLPRGGIHKEWVRVTRRTFIRVMDVTTGTLVDAAVRSSCDGGDRRSQSPADIVKLADLGVTGKESHRSR